MTFEEWFQAYEIRLPVIGEMRDELQEAWEAGADAEREACAQLVSTMAEGIRMRGDVDQILSNIRKREEDASQL